MFRFAIKKWFFDFWDHLLLIMLCNVVMDMALALPVFVPSLLDPNGGPLFWITLLIGILVNYAVVVGVNGLMWDISRGEGPSRESIVRAYKRGLVPGLVLGTINLAFGALAFLAMQFYGSLGDFTGMILMALVFWFLMFWLMMASYFLPFNSQMETKLSKLFRKSYLVFSDNPAFSLGMGAWSLLILVLTAVSITLLPGVAGLLLWHQTCLKLRLRKYDYLEEHPDADSRKVPWADLLYEEKERVGHRTLKNMIFPWKD